MSSFASWTAGGFAQHLASLGLEVYILDFRGHGGSKECSFKTSSSYDWDLNDYLLVDLELAIRHIQDLHSKERLILCGHSMGGILSMVQAIRKGPQEIAMLIMLGAPLDLRFSTRRVRLASYVINQIIQIARKNRIPWKTVPMDMFFRGIEKACFGCGPGFDRLLPLLVLVDTQQIISRLWHPMQTEKKVVRHLLKEMEAEPVGVVQQLTDWAIRGGIHLGRPNCVDYSKRFSSLEIPSIGAWGDEDLLAPKETVSAFYNNVDPTLHHQMLLPQTNHIDLTAGASFQIVIEKLKETLAQRVCEQQSMQVS